MRRDEKGMRTEGIEARRLRQRMKTDHAQSRRRFGWYRRLWLRAVLPGADLSDDQHRRVAEEAFDDVWFSQWYPWYLVVLLCAASVSWIFIFPIMGGLSTTAYGPASGGATLLLALVLLVLLPVVSIVLIEVTFQFCCRILLGRMTRRAMRRTGIDICINCGYLLIGVDDSAQCPECGALREAPV